MKRNKGYLEKTLNIGILCVFIVAIGTIVYAAFVSPNSEYEQKENISDFSEEWIYYADGQSETIDLPYASVSDTLRNFKVSKKLPTVLPKDAVLYIKTNHNQLTAFVENEQLQIKGIYKNRAFGTSTSEMYALIYLEPEYAGKTITLQLTETNDNPGINFGGAIITNQNNLTISLLQRNLFAMILVVSMVTVSAILFVMAILCRRRQTGMKCSIFASLSVFIYLAALWTLFDSNVLSIGFGYNDFQYFASFYTLMLMPLPFTIFMREILNTGRKIFNGIIVLIILSFLTSSVLLFCGHLSSLITPLPIFHVLIIVSLVAAVGVGGYEYVKYRKKHVLLILFGILFFGFFAIFALIAFYRDNSGYSILFRMGFFGFALCLCFSTIRYATVIVHNAAESNENKIKALKAQNNLRVNQIGTHFFYHVMNTTRVLIKKNPDAAYKMLGDISKYLRYKTDSSDVVGNIVKFSEEMKSIKAYVDMKQILLGNRLKVICEINTEDFYIPVLSIQPLVENAIKHGIEPKECGGTVKITVDDNKDYYIVAVEDDGIGFDQEIMLDSKHLSVSQSNIKERLAYYGDNEITVRSIPNAGTKIVVKFLKGLEKTNENDISR